MHHKRGIKRDEALKNLLRVTSFGLLWKILTKPFTTESTAQQHYTN